MGRETALQECVWGEGWLAALAQGRSGSGAGGRAARPATPAPDLPVEYRFDTPSLAQDFQWLRTPIPTGCSA